jgi:hypothetical protein
MYQLAKKDSISKFSIEGFLSLKLCQVRSDYKLHNSYLLLQQIFTVMLLRWVQEAPELESDT